MGKLYLIDYAQRQEKLHQQALNERLVDTVMTYSPSTQKSEWQSIDFEDITPYTWKWIDLELVHKDSSISKVSLRRPNWWILSVGADTVGDKVYINLPEMGIDGWASLRAIRANYLDTRFWNENRQGDYVSRPITAKFEHQTKSFYNLYFENIAEPLGVTSTHPIWSIDRNTWVKAGDLKVDEALKTQNGKVVLKSKDLIQQPQTVYNLEIYRDHNYSVSADKVLVHNTCPYDLLSHEIGVNGEVLGASFEYSNGYTVDLLANRAVNGDMLELTDVAFYPRGAVGNELANLFERRAMMNTLGKLKEYAKANGFKRLRISYQRALNSSSATPGHVYGKIFNLD